MFGQKRGKNTKPNVVILYFDDLGYGDMGSNFPTGLKIPKKSKYLNTSKPTLTPNLDDFAAQGIRFTNGHSASGVCSPSRYALLTGRYAWRTSLKKGVVGGYSKTFMKKNEFTIASMFKELGYYTAMVGKWHIGMQFYSFDNKPVDLGNNPNVLENNLIDFSKPLTDTPFHHGFDYYYGTASSLDMPPYAWIESKDRKVHVLEKGGVVKNGKVDFSQAKVAENKYFEEGKIPQGGRSGAYDPNFKTEDYLQIQAEKVTDLIKKKEVEGKPFFIYIPMPAPHSPHALQENFIGATGFRYGDYLVQSDYYFGKIIEALGDSNDPKSIAANTVVLVTSDNGPEKAAYWKGQNMNHDSNGEFKGIKRDSWEGGTRVPLLVRWPGIVNPGATTDEPLLQGDFIATMAEYLGYKLDHITKAPDAESFLPILKGNKMVKKRMAIVEHSAKGQFAIIDSTGEWKFIDGSGGGGNKTSPDANNNLINNALGRVGGRPGQLYNLMKDVGEHDNLLVDNLNDSSDNSDPTPFAIAKAKELYMLLNKIRGNKEKGTGGSSYVKKNNN